MVENSACVELDMQDFNKYCNLSSQDFYLQIEPKGTRKITTRMKLSWYYGTGPYVHCLHTWYICTLLTYVMSVSHRIRGSLDIIMSGICQVWNLLTEQLDILAGTCKGDLGWNS